ncbi:MAG: hypothetical protein ABJH63_06740 [Rhizobiaceae bacterium]
MNRNWTLGLSLLAVVVAGAGYGAANLMQGQHSAGEHVGHSSASAPKEAGQSAFAATAEIVALLSNDPQADWSKVNIAALRQHLVDMNALFLQANVSAIPQPDGWRYQVTGSGTVLRAIQAMVPAHAIELDKMDDWSASATKTDAGAELRVTSSSAETRQKIKGLGFFGLMATGAHHQPHHLSMATGKSTHH